MTAVVDLDDELDVDPMDQGVTEEAERENVYPHLAAFVADWLAPVYAHEWERMDREWLWCSRWWLHTEAVVRREAVWKAWELLRLDLGTGPACGCCTTATPAWPPSPNRTARSTAAAPVSTAPTNHCPSRNHLPACSDPSPSCRRTIWSPGLGA